jgi:DNA-binding NarL/FixJ family response regulator
MTAPGVLNLYLSLAGAVMRKGKSLSERELAILHLLMHDCPGNKAIARKLKITEGTVKVHVKAILRKLQVRSRYAAAMWAIKNLSAAPELAVTTRFVDNINNVNFERPVTLGS